ncbi:MAG: quinolinate synthase NadA [Candidatus Freyarchaeota archaeon]|nr:quinolinate synthase NadA [Candidatus Jordarchaeia archaeon]MBS7269367.1 quinolinate synthase NadA [Candidatus Jordarchaeia archaeon]MBS7278290.1 quinolinate synthase NadA [Candidatus Jordarchaeia archaeon]
MRELQEEILKLKKSENVFIAAHNYQRPEIQEIADVLGDSLELAMLAQKNIEGDIIVFCGVDFMAETMSILNPDAQVYVPEPKAKCPMAAMCPKSIVEKAKKEHPGLPVVLYVNTLAEAKAEADVMCTSANAAKVVGALGSDKVLFGPDANLAAYVEKRTGVKTIPVPEDGYCIVHVRFTADKILELKNKYPDAVILVHPECEMEVQEVADVVASTSQMLKYVKDSKERKFIIGTETGLIDRMRREVGGNKIFIPASETAICRNMKLNTLEKIRDVIISKSHNNLIKVPERIAEKARNALEKMFELTR